MWITWIWIVAVLALAIVGALVLVGIGFACGIAYCDPRHTPPVSDSEPPDLY